MYIHIYGEGTGEPLQYSCLENPMGGGAWWAAVHGVTRSRTQLSNFTFTFHFHALEKEVATHSSILAWRIPGTGAWWAAVYGVAQSRTRLKRLGSSSIHIYTRIYTHIYIHNGILPRNFRKVKFCNLQQHGCIWKVLCLVK